MVAGLAEVIEKEEILVAAARYLPNTHSLSIPFRSELAYVGISRCDEDGKGLDWSGQIRIGGCA
jgi:hypothetical protein